jgi:hypothetical protein
MAYELRSPGDQSVEVVFLWSRKPWLKRVAAPHVAGLVWENRFVPEDLPTTETVIGV